MFFNYLQNNSGGFYTDPAEFVIIEADDYTEADKIAESVGLYFDGEGDCECCGNRWYSAKWNDFYNAPMLYGFSIYSFPDDSDLKWYIGRSVMVVRKDSTVEFTTIQEAKKCLNP